MACLWIKSTENLKNGISIMNTVQSPKLPQFINRITENLNTPPDNIFSSEEITKLGIMFQISDTKYTVLMIKTIHFLLKKMSKYIFKPAELEKDLVLSLDISEDKSKLLVNSWLEITRKNLQNISMDTISENAKINYQINTELSSSEAKVSAVPKACLNLETVDDRTINLELTHKELHGLYLVLEAIQSEVDGLG